MFELLRVDPGCAARRGRLVTRHGVIATPVFMPVGTQATVKGLTVAELQRAGTQILLGNTYHLTLRPGEDLIARLGGLHEFMGWHGPILTDSGGFQIFSLAAQAKITEEGALFQSHIDGRRMMLTPERAMEIQWALGSDIAMVLDHVLGLPAPDEALQAALERSTRWARRCRERHRELSEGGHGPANLGPATQDATNLGPANLGPTNLGPATADPSVGDAAACGAQPRQVPFAIVQGGLSDALRRQSAEELLELDFPGYAVGGLSVGEPPEEMYRVLEGVVPLLPADRPRYLMGVGRPEDLLEGIARGIDMFDCVMPTRNGRNALAFTDEGTLRLRNRRHWDDHRPLMEGCSCPACGHSRAYLRHLFVAGEMLGPILLSAHNVTYYQQLLARAREAIERGEFMAFRRERLAQWGQSGSAEPDSAESS